MVSAEQKEYAEVSTYKRITENNHIITGLYTDRMFEKILQTDNLNKWSGGVDEISVDELLLFLRNNQVQLIQQLKDRKYKLTPVRMVEILKVQGLPDIDFHQLWNTYTTILLKNDFSIKGISNMLGHSKEIISADIYGDTQDVIEDCQYAIEPFIEFVMPKCGKGEYYDYSDMEDIENLAEEYLRAA